jgi:flagellar protein FlgJ
MLNSDTASVYTDFNGLAKLKQSAREQSPEAIKEVAGQFESVFLNMVLKSMREAKLADSVLDSKQSEFYRDMYDQQMALYLARKPGVGLADLIVKQLTPSKESNDDEKIHAGDYLNRALGSSGTQVVRQLSQTRPQASVKDSSVDPLEASGLRRLQESLDRMENKLQELDEKPLAAIDGEIAANKQLFFSQLLPYAQQAANKLGVDANVLIAQAALETGWGQSVIKNSQGENSFNLFNIKADKSWQGKQTQVSTMEYQRGMAKNEFAGFRSYDSYKESFDDYVHFIKSNPRYGKALKNAGNAAQYVRELQKAGYATDPRYAEKIMSIYNSPITGRVEANAG